MAWEDDEALGEEVRGEHIDGLLVTSPFPSRQRQSASRRLANLHETHVAHGDEVTGGWGWKPARDDHGPDVVVHPRTIEQVRFTGVGETPGRPGMAIDVPALLIT